jgi:hypothetical protein
MSIGNKIDYLIESFEADNDQQYVYHYSALKFAEVKTRKMLGLPAPKEASNPDKYNQTVSLSPSPLSKDTINKYRDSGFKAWGHGPLYEYKISIPKNVSAFVGDIRLTSVPEQLAYTRRYPLDKVMAKQGIDMQKAIKDNSYWEEVKEDYLRIKREWYNDLDKYIRHMIGQALTSRNYADHPYIKKIKNSFDYWVDFNLHRGDKNQYASYIPHIHTKIDKPLIPESVQQII